MTTTAIRGNQAEAKVLAALVAAGHEVLLPFGGGQPYDLVLHIDGSAFLRIQCKTGWEKQDCVVFNSRTTDHGRGRRPYTGLADLFGVYFPNDSSVFLVPVRTLPGFQGRLRLRPPRNNQRRGIRMAADYRLDRWSADRLRELIAASSEAQPVVA